MMPPTNLRSVAAHVYRGGRSIGSRQVRNFCSFPELGEEREAVTGLYLWRCVSAAVGYGLGYLVLGDFTSEVKNKYRSALKEYRSAIKEYEGIADPRK